MRNNEIFRIANGILAFVLGFTLFNVIDKRTFDGFGFELSMILFFSGIAVRTNDFIACLAGFIGNLAVLVGFGIDNSELLKYISIICFALLGVFSSTSFFLCDYWFILGLFFSNLMILLLHLFLNLSDYLKLFPYFLVLISFIQILLLYTNSVPKNHKDKIFLTKSNTTKYSDYYSSYPPSNLATLILFFLYCNYFTQTSQALFFISKFNSTLSPINLSLSLMACLSTSSLIFILLEPLSQIQIKLSILITTILSFLIYPLSLYSTEYFLISSIFLLPYSLKSLSLLKFFIYGTNKTLPSSFLALSSSFGSLFICTSITITSSEPSIPTLIPPFLIQLCSLTAFSISIPSLHPHPSFIPINSECDLPLPSSTHAYSIRKSLQNSLLMQL